MCRCIEERVRGMERDNGKACKRLMNSLITFATPFSCWCKFLPRLRTHMTSCLYRARSKSLSDSNLHAYDRFRHNVEGLRCYQQSCFCMLFNVLITMWSCPNVLYAVPCTIETNKMLEHSSVVFLFHRFIFFQIVGNAWSKFWHSFRCTLRCRFWYSLCVG